MYYRVSVENSIVTEHVIEADDPTEAEGLAREAAEEEIHATAHA